MTTYYTVSGNPVVQTRGSSKQIRDEFTLIQTAFANVDTILATKASPTFTGTVVLPSTTSIGNVSSTELAYLDGVTSAIQTQLNALVAVDATKAPTAGPTLTGAVDMTGASSVTAPTVTAGDNTTKVATTAFVTTAALTSVVPVTAPDSGKYLTNNGTSASWGSLSAYATTAAVAAAYAPLASPTLTGAVDMTGASTVTAPTLTAGDNTTKVATTAFVTGAVGGYAADAIGTYAFAKSIGQIVAFGGTIAGSNLFPVNVTETTALFNSPVPSLTGTWRCMGHTTAGAVATLYLRIS